MAYTRKTKDVFEIQGYYGIDYGWEYLCEEDTYPKARERLKEYNENEMGVQHRIRKRRVKIV